MITLQFNSCYRSSDDNVFLRQKQRDFIVHYTLIIFLSQLVIFLNTISFLVFCLLIYHMSISDEYTQMSAVSIYLIFFSNKYNRQIIVHSRNFYFLYNSNIVFPHSYTHLQLNYQVISVLFESPCFLGIVAECQNISFYFRKISTPLTEEIVFRTQISIDSAS